ncbi:MAG TPA: DUF5666 domain-containing protein [Acidobacteriota bacterium]|nr:DUF5666 domain-containing protein [Acidobacteriota bacterium]
MRAMFICLTLIIAISIWAGPSVILAQELNNNEVQFTGTISSLVTNGEGLGTVFVRVESFDLRVLVNSKTELTDKDGDEIKMSDLAKDLPIEVTGRYSSSGILAFSIRLVEDAENTFELRGHITGTQASNSDLLVSLLGITVVVNKDTKIEDDGADASPASLKTGMLVQVKGTTLANPWTATSIEVISRTTKKDKVRFEGVIAEVGSDFIQVAVQGLTSNVTKVLLNANTITTGDLVKDALVLVIGYLNPDLSVTAKEVRVLQALEIKPDERKLRVGQTATFTVKLRESAAADVPVSVKSGDTAVLTISPDTVTVLKGTNVADFTAAAVKIGSTEITAEALGQKATANVMVGEVSEDENERPAGEARTAFAPAKIKLGINETRDVVLLIKPPQQVPVKVEFKVKNDLVKVIGTRELGMGAAELKVSIQSGSKEGSDSVVATLPEAIGGAVAELLIEVSTPKGGTGNQAGVEIAFRPDGIKLPTGESRSVKLMLNHSLEKDVPVTLTINDSGIIEVPATVSIPAGEKLVQVSVKGIKAGKVKVTATLPQDLSTDTAELDVEVKI